MTGRNKFEEMLERLVNEDRDAAEALFHEIVVEKSREIYQSILESEDDDEEVDENKDEDLDEENDEDLDESKDEEVDESNEDDDLDESTDDDIEEMFGLDELAPDDDADAMGGMPGDMGGDATDDMMGDMSDESGDVSEPATKADIMDLADALAELQAEFEAQFGDTEGDDEDDNDDFGSEEDDSEKDDDGEEDDNDNFSFSADDDDKQSKEAFQYEAKKTKKTASEEMREYVEKIGGDQYQTFGKMGDNGSNTKSIVAGKNDMGGTTANIAKNFSTTQAGTKGGLADPSVKVDNAKNINVPGGKAGVKHLKNQPAGHGAEKKGAGEKADKSAGSMLNGAPKRAK